MHLKAEKAKEHGEDSFKLGDKEFPVKEAKEDDVCPECDRDPCECDDEKEKGWSQERIDAAKKKGEWKSKVDEAQELLAMLRVAGLDTRQIEEALAKDEKTYGDPEVDDNTSDQDPVNGPKEKYMSMKASTLNPGEGDWGEKNNYDGPGDNKMKQQPNRPAKPVRSVKEAFATMEAKSAAEYESIKKVN